MFLPLREGMYQVRRSVWRENYSVDVLLNLLHISPYMLHVSPYMLHVSPYYPTINNEKIFLQTFQAIRMRSIKHLKKSFFCGTCIVACLACSNIISHTTVSSAARESQKLVKILDIAIPFIYKKVII